MHAVESGVTQQMQTTMTMLARSTTNYDDQAKALEVKQMQSDMEARLGALEAKPLGSSAAGSTVDTEQNRKPVIIIGGCSRPSGERQHPGA